MTEKTRGQQVLTSLYLSHCGIVSNSLRLCYLMDPTCPKPYREWLEATGILDRVHKMRVEISQNAGVEEQRKVSLLQTSLT